MIETTPTLKNREVVEGRPTVAGGESVLYTAKEPRTQGLLFGVVLTFIPPFVWGPALLYLVLSSDSGVIVTDQRVLMFSSAGLFKRGKYHQFQVTHRQLVSARIMEGRRDLTDRLTRVGDVMVEYEPTDGTAGKFLAGKMILPGIKKPKELVRAIMAAKEKYGRGA